MAQVLSVLTLDTWVFLSRHSFALHPLRILGALYLLIFASCAVSLTAVRVSLLQKSPTQTFSESGFHALWLALLLGRGGGWCCPDNFSEQNVFLSFSSCPSPC